MNLNTILSIFTPKDTKFIPLLKESAVILVQTATLTNELFHCTNENIRKELCISIKSEETRGDEVTSSIFKSLNETFITPFDREDIGLLGDGLDDIVDALHRSSEKVSLYSPKSFSEHTIRMAEIAKECSIQIQLAVNELSRMKHVTKNLREHCREIKRLEKEGDRVYEIGIMNIFENETNAVELIKSKEIIQELEKSLNKMNSVAKILKTFIVKYS